MITHDAQTRDKLAKLKREIKALESPDKAVRKAALKRSRKEREKALVRVHGQREPRVRDNGYLQFVRRQPCAGRALGDCDGPIEAAHIRYGEASSGKKNPGMGRKPDDKFALPLCKAHHTAGHNAQHSMNEQAFWRMVGVDPLLMCVTLYAYYISDGNDER